jgi:DNA-binding protein YbaB
MTTPMENDVQQALDEFERQRERIQRIRAEMAETSTTVRSKDRSIGVTVDSRGAVTAIEFGGTKFRRMAPTELGAALVETIQSARAAAMEQVAGAFQPVFPASTGVAGLLSGTFDLDQMFAEALRVAREPMPGEQPTVAEDYVPRGVDRNG